MNHSISEGFYRIAVVSFIGIVVGSIASLLAIAFVEIIAYLNELLLISPHSRIKMGEEKGLLILATICVPTLGGFVVGLIIFYGTKERRPLGPADVILTVQTRQPPPDTKSGALTTLAALLSLGCGASVGQYGPLVYMGSMIGSIISKLKFKILNLQAIAISCGVAASIATAFNAPIAGIIFAHEIILRHYSLQAFAPVTVASATGYVFANVIFSRPALFKVEFDKVGHSYEFLFFALEGILCAVLALVFMRAILRTAKYMQTLNIPNYYKPALAGLILGVTALWIPEILGVGKESLRFATVENAFSLGELSLIVVFKIILTVICIGFGFAGGVFSPSLLIGILFGALYGLVLNNIFPLPISHIVVYAICGMMAFTSPVIGAPLTAILIVFELTRSYDLTIAAMVSVVFANIISYRLFGRSLFDVQLLNRGFDLSLGRDKAVLGHHTIESFINLEYVSIRQGATVGALVDLATANNRSEIILLDEKDYYLGLLKTQRMAHLSNTTVVDSSMCSEVSVFNLNTSLWDAMQIMQEFVGEAVPVVDENSDRMLGVITEGDVIRAYFQTVHELRGEENEIV